MCYVNVFLYARHSMEMHELSGYGIEECWTEATLRWKSFRKYNKIDIFIQLTISLLNILNVNQSKGEGSVLETDTMNRSSVKSH